MIPETVREEEETFEDDRAAVLVARVASTQRDRRRHRSHHRRDREHRVVLEQEDEHHVPMIGTIHGTGITQLSRTTLKHFLINNLLIDLVNRKSPQLRRLVVNNNNNKNNVAKIEPRTATARPIPGRDPCRVVEVDLGRPTRARAPTRRDRAHIRSNTSNNNIGLEICI